MRARHEAVLQDEVLGMVALGKCSPGAVSGWLSRLDLLDRRHIQAPKLVGIAHDVDVGLYYSELGVKKLRHEFSTPRLGTQDEVERTLWTEAESVKALEYFRLVDPLVKLSVRVKTAYNPFRDVDRLKKKHQEWVRKGRPRS